MSSLYAAFDTVQDEPSSSGRRGFKPDEMMDRRMIAAINDKPSVICTWCGNRVRLDAARLQPGGWRSQDYYLCTACIKYGPPEDRQPHGGHICWSCKMDRPEQDYWLAGGEFGDVEMCNDCKESYSWATVAGMFKRIYRGKPELSGTWWRVLPLNAEHECGVCHEFKPDVPLYNWAPWLRKTGIAHVCADCNAIAAEV